MAIRPAYFPPRLGKARLRPRHMCLRVQVAVRHQARKRLPFVTRAQWAESGW